MSNLLIFGKDHLQNNETNPFFLKKKTKIHS
jgi:hypothetical protein